MPLTAKGEKIMASLVEQYGEEKAKRIFYAGKNSGRFTGVDSEEGVFDEGVAFTEMVVFDQDQPHFKKTSDGYLVATPRVARTGIQLYAPKEVGRNFDRMVRIYRPESEVFSQNTIKSFAHRPVTLDHPPEMVNDANWRKYSRGNTTDPIVRDGDHVRVSVLLMDKEIIQAFESGKNQLSVGYTCDLKWEPGTTEDGEDFDGIQTNIIANHLALVSNARGGEKLRIGDAPDEEFYDQELVHCPDCDAMIPDEATVCPNCGYEMIDGEERDLADDEHLYDGFEFVEDYNPNHGPDGKFATGPGGGSGQARTRKPSTTAKSSALKEHGYQLTKAGAKYGVKYPQAAGGGHSGNRWLTKEEAVAHAEEHAKASGVKQEPAPPPPPNKPPGATAAPVQGPKQPRSGAHEPDFFGPEPGGPPAPHSGQRQAAATAAATGVTSPEAKEEERGAGRPRLRNPDGTFVHPRPGEAGYVARGGRASGGGGGEGATSGGSGFSTGKTTFSSYGEAKRHIRQQRRRWRWARPVRSPGTFVSRRGLGFTRARIPGLRKQVRSPFYTVTHDEDFLPWMIVFDDVLDLMPLTDAELSDVELVDLNRWHDPETGEFTSGPGTGGGRQSGFGGFIGPPKPFTKTGTSGPEEPRPIEHVRQLAQESKIEANRKQFNTQKEAEAHAQEHLAAWKRHHTEYEHALKEIKRQQRKWESAKVLGIKIPNTDPIPGRIHTVRSPGFVGLLKGVRGYRVHVDSFDHDVELSDVDMLQAREWEEQLQIEDNSSVPETDEIEQTYP